MVRKRVGGALEGDGWREGSRKRGGGGFDRHRELTVGSDCGATGWYQSPAADDVFADPALAGPTLREDATRALRRVLGDDSATFRLEGQALALEAALRGVPLLLVVLPTGGGKSLLYMGPPFVKGADGALAAYTLVVVPFVALCQGTLERCRSASLTAEEWALDSDLLPRILLVSVEQAVGDAFLT